jgi:glycine betaine/choline ABC-type transport system substrate-binding protein
MTLRRLAAVLVAALIAGACTSAPAEVVSPTATGPVIRIGSGPEAESQLLAAILAELLTMEGFRPAVVERADAGAARQALEVGDVDVLPGYTGQAWLEVLGRPNPPGDPRTSFARVRSVDEANGILWLRPTFDLDAGLDGPPANATFGLFVRGIPSRDADLRTIAQLATRLSERLAERPDTRVCVDPQFGVRPDGWEVVATTYSIADLELTGVSPRDAIRGVAAGECLVGLGTTTDGDAWHAGLRLLEDPLQVFPAFVVAVQAREEVVAAQPTLVAALEPFTAHLTTRLLGTWNGRVADGDDLGTVAATAAAALRRAAGRDLPPPAPTATD